MSSSSCRVARIGNYVKDVNILVYLERRDCNRDGGKSHKDFTQS